MIFLKKYNMLPWKYTPKRELNDTYIQPFNEPERRLGDYKWLIALLIVTMVIAGVVFVKLAS